MHRKTEEKDKKKCVEKKLDVSGNEWLLKIYLQTKKQTKVFIVNQKSVVFTNKEENSKYFVFFFFFIQNFQLNYFGFLFLAELNLIEHFFFMK